MAAKKKAVKPVQTNAASIRKTIASTLQEKATVKAQGKRASSSSTASTCCKQTMSKCLRDNYRGSDGDLLIRNGISLRAYLRNARDNGEKMGKNFHDNVRILYGIPVPGSDELVIADDSQLTDDRLVKALKSVFQHKKQHAPLDTFLATSSQLNQKNYTVLAKAMLKLSPVKGMENANLWLSFLAFSKRTGAKTAYPKEFAAVRPMAGDALLKTHANCVLDELTTKDWWDSIKDVADIIIPRDAMDACVSVSSCWRDVKDELEECSQASTCIDAIFAVGLSEVRGLEALDLLNRGVESMKLLTNITQVAIDTKWAEVNQQLLDFGVDPTEPVDGLQVTFKFRRVLSSTVHTYHQAWELMVQAFLREVALVKDKLSLLWCEAELEEIDACEYATIQSIEPALYAKAGRLREKLLSFIPELKDQSKAQIDEIFKNKVASLALMDPYVIIEKAYFSSFDEETEECQKLFHTKVLACFPPAGATASIESCMKELRGLSQSKFMAYIGGASRAALQKVEVFLAALQKKARPAFHEVTETQFFKDVKVAMARLISVTPPASASGGIAPKTLTGKDAAEQLLTMCEDVDKSTAGKELFQDVKKLESFGWLLDDDQTAALVALRDSLVKVKMTASKTKVGMSASSSSGDRPAKKPKTDLGSSIVEALLNGSKQQPA